MNKRGVFTAALILLFSAVYGLTLVPGIGLTGDSIKFQYVGRVLGVPHATGYPLYLLLNHLFTAIPVKTVAFRANLMSAFFAVLTLVMIFLFMTRLTGAPFVSFLAASFFGLTATFWSQAVVAEVYTLAAFSLAAILWALGEWQATRKSAFFIVFLFVYGLSLGNHLTIVVCLPAALAFVVLVEPRAFGRLKYWILGLAALGLGLGQYGILFLRTAQGAPYLEHEVRTFHDLVPLLSGHQFQTQMFAFSFSQVITERVPLLFKMLIADITWPGMLFALAGMVLLFLKKRKVFVLLFLVFLGEALWVMNTNIRDIQTHMIPVVLAGSLAAGFGLASLLSLWKGRAAPLLPLAVLPFLVWLAAVNIVHIDLRRNPEYRTRLEENFKIRALFENVPPYAVILTDGYPDAQNVHSLRLIDFQAKNLIPHLLNPQEPVVSQLTTKLVISLQTLPALQERLGLRAELEGMRGQSRESVGFKLMHLLKNDRRVQEGFASHIYVFSEDLRKKLENVSIPLKPLPMRDPRSARKFLFYRVAVFDGAAAGGRAPR